MGDETWIDHPPRTRWERIGRIAVFSAHVENLIYEIGEELAVPREEIRCLSGTAAAEKVRDVVLERGTFPPWMSVSPEEVRAWASTAKGVLKQRNQVLHAIDVQVSGPDGLQLRRKSVGVSDRTVPSSDAELDRVIRDIESVQREGSDVRTGLLLCMRPRVYISFFSGGVRMNYEGGEWPAEGERAAVDRHVPLAIKWGEQIMRGEPTPSGSYESPTGPRAVPPFFFLPLDLTAALSI
ncbi:MULTISPECIES: hypothetical protein [unclassified Microbacterium]|uniref:hypothetical protein n=1 Tax=unclassified Microbacterium TaxID=2609290 RepID=UPI003016BC8C